MLFFISQHCTLTPPLYIEITKQDRLYVSGEGEGNRGVVTMETDLEKSRFHLLPFHAKIVEVFSPDPFVISLCLEKYIEGLMESASKSNLTLKISSTYLSEHCFTWEVSANTYNKTLMTLLLPIILLLFSFASSVVTKGVPVADLLNWEGKKQRKSVRRKNQLGSTEWRRSTILSTSAEWKPNRRQQSPGIRRVYPETKENFLNPLSTCHTS